MYLLFGLVLCEVFDYGLQQLLVIQQGDVVFLLLQDVSGKMVDGVFVIMFGVVDMCQGNVLDVVDFIYWGYQWVIVGFENQYLWDYLVFVAVGVLYGFEVEQFGQ